MDKIKLNVLGISYSQTQTGAYALILAEEEGERRIPIIIGGFEAQAIAIELEGLKPPRPLTHDLLVSFAEAYNIEVVDITINRLEEGIFYSEINCFNGTNRIKIDARTSDSIALALRFKCPIYTTLEVMEKAGIQLETEHQENAGTKSEDENKDSQNAEYAKKTTDELKGLMNEAIEKENYELASRLRDEIQKRENQ
ncbi:MAG: bifunctional nuclease family protein [Salinivirgaceae bacterium]|nr:bifunctional nuclease family protein [Salinivirgaceae bacterium]